MNSFQHSICAPLPVISDQSKGLCVSMTTELGFSFLEEGFSAKDIVEQKIKESSMTVNVLCIKLFSLMQLSAQACDEQVSLFYFMAG